VGATTPMRPIPATVRPTSETRTGRLSFMHSRRPTDMAFSCTSQR
jgi:hypothetical protein